MSDMAFEILEQLKENPNFYFSSEAIIKDQQRDAIEELENNGYIIVEANSVGYVIVKVL